MLSSFRAWFWVQNRSPETERNRLSVTEIQLSAQIIQLLLTFRDSQLLREINNTKFDDSIQSISKSRLYSFTPRRLLDSWCPNFFEFKISKKGKLYQPSQSRLLYNLETPFSIWLFTLTEPVGHGHQHTVDNLDLLKRKRNVASSPWRIYGTVRDPNCLESSPLHSIWKSLLHFASIAESIVKLVSMCVEMRNSQCCETNTCETTRATHGKPIFLIFVQCNWLVVLLITTRISSEAIFQIWIAPVSRKTGRRAAMMLLKFFIPFSALLIAQNLAKEYFSAVSM